MFITRVSIFGCLQLFFERFPEALEYDVASFTPGSLSIARKEAWTLSTNEIYINIYSVLGTSSVDWALKPTSCAAFFQYLLYFSICL